MPRRIIALLLAAASLLALSSCSSILEGEQLSEVPHVDVETSPPVDKATEVSTLEELREEIISQIETHKATRVFTVSDYDGDILFDTNSLCREIPKSNPLGAYAVESMEGTVSQLVTYYEVTIDIEYKRTAKEINEIITASTLRYLKLELLSALTEYEDGVVFMTTAGQVSEETAQAYIGELYYENPMQIVITPVTTVEIYPEDGNTRIIEFTFGYSRNSSTLKAMASDLSDILHKIAEATKGDNDAAILLELCTQTMNRAEYDEGYNESTASLGDYSTQNFITTAYGALINGTAIGEGYAMAYKALCDCLGIECYVVHGSLDGVPHVWNIVLLEGDFYHVDVAMSDVHGPEEHFLMSDETIGSGYEWDTETTRACTGELTYKSLFGKPEPPDEPVDDGRETDVDEPQNSDA